MPWGICPGRWLTTTSFSPLLPREKRIRRQRDCAHALRGGSVLRDSEIAGQARDRLGKTMAAGIVALLFQPCLYQYRHEHSNYARDGRATAAAELRRIISARLVNRHGHVAKRIYLIEGRINYE